MEDKFIGFYVSKRLKEELQAEAKRRRLSLSAYLRVELEKLAAVAADVAERESR